jgi:hypothetical protein
MDKTIVLYDISADAVVTRITLPQSLYSVVSR